MAVDAATTCAKAKEVPQSPPPPLHSIAQNQIKQIMSRKHETLNGISIYIRSVCHPRARCIPLIQSVPRKSPYGRGIAIAFEPLRWLAIITCKMAMLLILGIIDTTFLCHSLQCS